MRISYLSQFPEGGRNRFLNACYRQLRTFKHPAEFIHEQCFLHLTLKRESEIDRRRSATAQTGRKLDTIIIAMLVLVLATVLYDRLQFDDSDDDRDPGGPWVETVNPDSVIISSRVSMNSAWSTC